MPSPRSAGLRRRGSALEEAILDAGWEQLVEAGYERFTIDTVAARSSSARSVLYRRWPSRLDLLQAVIRRRGQIDTIAVPDTGCLRSDVLTLLHEFNDRRAGLVGVIASMLAAYFTETGGAPNDLRSLFLSNRPKAMECIIEHAITRGELATTPPDHIMTLPIDLLQHEVFMTMAPAPTETITAIVDDIFLPLTR
ncbi:TetR/AcrR family transcriptional regulator [Mycobacteroides abscessus]|uniref:TetR/AcrR family transcriptional regulator n=1 Tax=Mycobacteroides abscessus TaxID=36809 RepID=UPI000941637F|nr:TetR/AcrR family transcriptional regulator [Mycobacteroides abscessus]